MHEHSVEKMTGADMVPVRVRLQHPRPARGEPRHQPGEIADAQSGIEHGHVVVPLDQVDLDVLAVVRLADHHHRVRETPHLEPIHVRHTRCLIRARPFPAFQG